MISCLASVNLILAYIVGLAITGQIGNLSSKCGDVDLSEIFGKGGNCLQIITDDIGSSSSLSSFGLDMHP
ncbi:unnamed protein product [Enterobius vermicularis]|uniref:Secreted protein n=1 Tax=Enterobius vermicularis TaxID=51028 RepID=A0A0N4VRG7_ENTVE|nr:unnamed protein product [Enterobius vermicularis]